jgi:hypothetical protein
VDGVLHRDGSSLVGVLLGVEISDRVLDYL